MRLLIEFLANAWCLVFFLCERAVFPVRLWWLRRKYAPLAEKAPSTIRWYRRAVWAVPFIGPMCRSLYMKELWRKRRRDVRVRLSELPPIKWPKAGRLSRLGDESNGPQNLH